MDILFLDDDHAINRYHEIIFEELATKHKLSLLFYHDPVKVLDLLEKGELAPSLIFLDINMPIIDGWEFLEQYKARDLSREATISILTTSNDPHYLKRAKQTGMVSEYKVKPLDEVFFEKLVLTLG